MEACGLVPSKLGGAGDGGGVGVGVGVGDDDEDDDLMEASTLSSTKSMRRQVLVGIDCQFCDVACLH
jgi:hypothetical protein